jgi:hypothetical protein
MIDMRVRHIDDNGEFIASPSGVSLTLDQANQPIQLVIEGCEKLIASEGMSE